METDNKVSIMLRGTYAVLVILLIYLNNASTLTCQLKQTNYYSKQFLSLLPCFVSTLSSHQTAT
jgi:hypothetical protein